MLVPCTDYIVQHVHGFLDCIDSNSNYIVPQQLWGCNCIGGVTKIVPAVQAVSSARNEQTNPPAVRQEERQHFVDPAKLQR